MNNTDGCSGLTVSYLPIEILSAYHRNARTHSPRQIRQIAASITTFGFTNPVLIDRNNTIIAGHGRVAAAKRLGMDRVPTIRLEGLSDDEIRAYVMADNRLAEKAGWDKSILAIELQYLINLDTNFDVTLTGFDIPEIDLIIEEAKSGSKLDDDDQFIVPHATSPVTHTGDLWLLGKHRLLCGNSLESRCFELLMGSQRADVVFTDPPYNVPIDGHAIGNGSVHHPDFAMGSGEMNEAEFIDFLTMSFRLLARHSRRGSVHFVCMDWRHTGELLSAGRHIYGKLLNLCVWAKDNAGMGSFYRSQHELIFVFRNGKGRYRNNIQLGQHGRNRTNIWNYPNVNTLSRQGDEGNLLALHPTVKPVSLVADALLDCSARGEVVLDSFLGSGSTLIAAERVGRICAGIEIDPLYVDVAIRRWQKHTGDHAIHAVSGKLFDEIAAASEARNG
jgi:DNA modification methylase